MQIENAKLLITIFTLQETFAKMEGKIAFTPNIIDKLILNWKQAICETLGDGKKTNKVFLEEIWLIPTLNNIKSFLDEDKHAEVIKEVDEIKKIWDVKWDK